MERLSLEALGDHAAYDLSVAASRDVDGFCSSTDWVVPAAEGLMPGRHPWIWRDGESFVALMGVRQLGRPWLEPLEAMWRLACPLVGAQAPAAAHLLAQALEAEAGRATVLLSGLAPGSERLRSTVRALEPRYGLGLASPTRRQVADLAGGVEVWRQRRSANFRRSLTRAERRAERAGVTVETVAVAPSSADVVWDRIAAVDDRTWKGESGVGVGAGPMAKFYRLMLRRLAMRGAARVLFARLGGRDAGYIFGGVRGDCYRGLQFGVAREAEPLSLGNLLQLRQIEALCAEGIRSYDLGAEVEYKRRWADRVQETVTLVALPR